GPQSSPPRQPGGPGAVPLPDQGGPAPQQGPAPAVGPAGGGAAKAGGGATMGGTGSITQEKVDGSELERKLETAKPEPKTLEVSPGLYFCDKDFKPVSALVLDKMIAGEAGGRVWIVLKLKNDKQSDKVETVTVK